VAGLGIWLVIASRPRVTRARFEQVEQGMSREEVNRTAGGPPGVYSETSDVWTPFYQWGSGNDAEVWWCDDGWMAVRFDDADRAASVKVFEFEPPTLTERIRRWLGL